MPHIDARTRLMLALDVPTTDEAQGLLDRVGNHIHIVKIGLELFTAAGPRIVQQVLTTGKQVFLDLKFFDIDETVKRATATVAKMGVQFLTVHAHGKTLRAAVEGRGNQLGLKILGVTVLTSQDVQDLREYGSTWSVEELVISRARLASMLGCDGVVASGRESTIIRQALGSSLSIVTPGVRQKDKGVDDHARATTPHQAIEAGADYLVVGRPIRDASDPVMAIEEILADMQSAFDTRNPSKELA